MKRAAAGLVRFIATLPPDLALLALMLAAIVIGATYGT